MAPKPSTTPAMCGRVRFSPNTEPEAISIRLFGPGVTQETTANTRKPANRAGLIMRGRRSCGPAATGVVFHHALGRRRVLQQLGRGPEWARDEVAATVGT